MVTLLYNVFAMINGFSLNADCFEKVATPIVLQHCQKLRWVSDMAAHSTEAPRFLQEYIRNLQSVMTLMAISFFWEKKGGEGSN